MKNIFILLFLIFIINPLVIYSQENKQLNSLKQELNLIEYLSDDLKQKIENHYINSQNKDVKEAYSIILNGHNLNKLFNENKKDILIPAYKIPKYNTALLIVAEIFKNFDIKENELLPLSIAIANSLLITFGDEDVKNATLKKCVEYYKFLKETSKLQKQKNLFSLKNYPLESQIFLAMLWNSNLNGPSFISDQKIKDEIFAGIYKKKINLKRFQWCTIKIENLYKLQQYFVENNLFTSNIRENIKQVLTFIDRENRWKYPIRSNMDKQAVELMYKINKGCPLEKMTYDGITCLNANWNNPNYIIEKQLSQENFYGWCTDVRQSEPFVAASMGIATIQTGGGIFYKGNEYSHYFVLYFIPNHNVWIRNTKDIISNPFDLGTPLLLKQAPINLGNYWKDGNEVFFIKDIKKNLLARFYDVGIPTNVVKDITFNNKTLTQNTIEEYAIDSDTDGISDYIENNFTLTDKNKIDTDNDGYSDTWEIENSYNPNDNKNPANLKELILDGIEDTPAINNKTSYIDPPNDFLGGNDIKQMNVFYENNILYIQVTYFQKNIKDCFHTIRIRNLNGKNYWIQGKPSQPFYDLKKSTNERYNISEFNDGEDSSVWKKSNISLSNIRFFDRDIFEASINLNNFDLGDYFQVNYAVSGKNGNNDIWNSDITNQLLIYKNKQQIAIDGKIDDLIKLENIFSLADPPNDVNADKNIYDLKKISAVKKDNNLYIFSEFYNDISQNEINIITYHIQSLATKTNYWIQFNGTYFLNAKTFKAGTPFEKWEKIPLGSDRLKNIVTAIEKNIETQIPLSFFTPEELKGKFKVRTLLGGTKLNKKEWNTEESEFIEF